MLKLTKIDLFRIWTLSSFERGLLLNQERGMKEAYKGVGLNINSKVHWTDHLAPICVARGIPLLMVDEKHAEEAQASYPGLQVLLWDWKDLNLQSLIEN